MEVKSSLEEVDVQGLLQTANYMILSDYAYIAYAVSASDAGKRDAKVRQYCRMFGIGLLHIIMPDKLYDHFIQGKIDQIDNTELAVTEVYFSRESKCYEVDRDHFLERYGITKLSHINDWETI